MPLRDVPANPALLRPRRPLPRKLGIVGAGTIGPDIGYYLASEVPGLELLLVDIAPAALERASERLHGYADKGVQRGKISAAQAAAVRAGLRTSSDYAALADCDWVIEAATEDLPLKRRIFSQIEAVVRPDAVITSNTSSLPAERLFTPWMAKPRSSPEPGYGVTNCFMLATDGPPAPKTLFSGMTLSVVPRKLLAPPETAGAKLFVPM